MSALHGILNARPWVRRALWIGVVAFGLALIPISLAREASADQVQRMRDELGTTHARSEKLRTDNAERARRIDALRNDERAVEEIARDELGMVFPGEVIFNLESARTGE